MSIEVSSWNKFWRVNKQKYCLSTADQNNYLNIKYLIKYLFYFVVKSCLNVFVENVWWILINAKSIRLFYLTMGAMVSMLQQCAEFVSSTKINTDAEKITNFLITQFH